MVEGLLFSIWTNRFPSAQYSKPHTHIHTYLFRYTVYCTYWHSLSHIHTHTHAHARTHTHTRTHAHTFSSPPLSAAYTCKSYTNQSRPGARGEQPGIAPKKPNPLYQTARCHYQSSSTGRCFHQAAARRHGACWSLTKSTWWHGHRKQILQARETSAHFIHVHTCNFGFKWCIATN